MKKSIALNACLAACALVLVAGCQNKKPEEAKPSAMPQAVVQSEEQPAAPTLSYLPGVALFKPGSLYKPSKEEDGLMVWSRNVNCGSVLEVYNYSDKGVEVKTATRVVNKTRQERQFVHVRYNDDDYWIQDVTLAVNAVPNVLIEEDTFIYKEPNVKSMTATALPFGTIVAVSTLKGDSNFTCISVDTEKETLHDVYVKAANVGFGDDMTILALVDGIKKAKSEVLRNELADALAHYSTNSSLVDEKRYEAINKVSQNIDGWLVAEEMPGFFYEANYGACRPDGSIQDSWETEEAKK